MDEEVSHVTSSKKRGPKPKGAGPHNKAIERRINELKRELDPDWEHVGGGCLKEEYIRTPGGTREARRPDITFRNKRTGEYYRENVGKTYKRGHPVKREVEALDDIEGATGTRPGFAPYDREEG